MCQSGIAGLHEVNQRPAVRPSSPARRGNNRRTPPRTPTGRPSAATTALPSAGLAEPRRSVAQIGPRVVQIELRRLGRVIGMRMIEAEQGEARFRRSRLSARRYSSGPTRNRRRCAIGERVVERVGLGHLALLRAQQGAAAFVRDRCACRDGRIAVISCSPTRRWIGASASSDPVGRHVPERIREIPVATVRENGDDDAGREVAGDLDRGGQRRATRRADEQAFLVRQAPRQVVGLVRV